MPETSTVTEHEHVWVPVIYGKPSWQAIEEAAAGKWILGGCMVDGKKAREGCVVCRVGRL